MKKLFLMVLCAAFAVNTYAQESNEAPAKKPSNKGFVTNGFWDNWEISAGFGATYEGIALGKDYGKAAKTIGWELNGSLTKWFHPIWGVRGQLQGGVTRGFASPTATARRMTTFLFAHADAMMNFSNWVGGYREDRVYYAVPFLGFGYQVQGLGQDSQSNNQEWAATIGLLNKFRVCNCVDINLELKGWLYDEKDHILSRGGKAITAFSATVGATYRFGKRDFERKGAATVIGDMVVEGPDAAAYAALLAEKDEALAAAAAEAEALREAAKKKPVEVIVEKKTDVYVGGKMVVFFGLGRTDISNNQQKIALDLKADQIKNGPATKIYTIEGHADSKTGSAATNMRISEARAKSVYDYLVKMGVNPEQLQYKGVGDKAEPFTTAETNRVAIID